VEIYQAAITVAVGTLLGVGFTYLWHSTASKTPSASERQLQPPNLPNANDEPLRLLQAQLNALEGKLSRPDQPLLESKFQLLEGQFRSLQLEWSQAHRHLDHLLRRGIRLGVLERKEQAEGLEATTQDSLPPPPTDSPKLSRHQLLQNHRAKSRVN